MTVRTKWKWEILRIKKRVSLVSVDNVLYVHRTFVECLHNHRSHHVCVSDHNNIEVVCLTPHQHAWMCFVARFLCSITTQDPDNANSCQPGRTFPWARDRETYATQPECFCSRLTIILFGKFLAGMKRTEGTLDVYCWRMLSGLTKIESLSMASSKWKECLIGLLPTYCVGCWRWNGKTCLMMYDLHFSLLCST